MEIKTGDMIACDGEGFTSAVIGGWTKFLGWFQGRGGYPLLSHTGGIVIHHGTPYIYHSTSSKALPDAVDAAYRSGVQCQRLDMFRKGYKGDVYYVPLRKRLLTYQDDAYVDYMTRMHREQIAYDKNGALGSAMPWRNRVVKDWEGKPIYCTALYGRALQRAERLPHNYNTREHHPLDALFWDCLDRTRIRRID